MQQETVQQLNSDNTKPVEKKRSTLAKLFDALLWISIIVLTVMVGVRAFLLTNITVSGLSMYPTYNDKDVVTISKVRAPKRGDVIVFFKRDVESKFLALFATKEEGAAGGKYEKLIKRVVALEGDKIWVEQIGQDLYQVKIRTASGELLDETKYKKDNVTISADRFIIDATKGIGLGVLENYTSEDTAMVIEAGHIFVMGDNRSNSDDSRTPGGIGQVPLTRLYGVVVRNK